MAASRDSAPGAGLRGQGFHQPLEVNYIEAFAKVKYIEAFANREGWWMQVDHAERINTDLRTELSALREEAAAAQERVPPPPLKP